MGDQTAACHPCEVVCQLLVTTASRPFHDCITVPSVFPMRLTGTAVAGIG